MSIFANICTQLVHEEVTDSRPPACYFGLSVGSIAMVSAMMQVIVIQMCVLPMYAELKDRTPAKFNRIVVISFSALFMMCSLFAVVGYLAFGANVSSNVLLNLPDTHWGHASRASAALAVMAVYPIVMMPMLAPLKSSELARKLGSVCPIGATLFIVAASAAAALYVTDLGFVNVINGALSCGAFVAVSPSLVGLYLLGDRSAAWNAMMYLLVIVGAVFSVLGLIMTDNYSAALHNACMWLHETPGHY
jgi:amino acid permease